MEEMPLGNRAELKRWRTLSWKMFDDIGIAKNQSQSEEKSSKKGEKS